MDTGSIDRLINAFYLIGGAYFTVELLKLASSWFSRPKATTDTYSSPTKRPFPKVTINNNPLIEDSPTEPKDLRQVVEALNNMQTTLKSLKAGRGVDEDDRFNVFNDSKSPNMNPESPTKRSSRLPRRTQSNIPEFDLDSRKRKESTNYEEFQFYKICITGGPCAGKTTAIASVSEKLRELGFTVFVVPEAATLIFAGGGDLDLSNYDEYSALKFQYYLLQQQKCLEDIYSEQAILNQKKVVVLCDRGVMDGSAYLTTDQWKTLVDEWDIDVVRMRDRRYDMVIHLVTAADGAEDFYSSGILGTNEARVENLQQSRDLDKKLQKAWMAHPCFVVIDNKKNKGFTNKIERVETAVMRHLGFPTSVKFNNKYLLRNNDGKLLDKLLNCGLVLEKSYLTDTYIKTKDDLSNNIHYLRMRWGDSVRKNFMKIRKTLIKHDEDDKDELVTIRRQITWKEYKSYEAMKAEGMKPITRERAVFLWKSKNFLVDCIEIDGYRFAILIIETEMSGEIEEIERPEVIENSTICEITDVEEWQMYNLARSMWNPPKEFEDQVRRM